MGALALGEELHGEWVKVIVEKPRTLLRADAAGISIVRRKDGARETEDTVFVKRLRVVTIIGVNPWERKERQNVVLNLTLHKPMNNSVRQVREIVTADPHYDYKKVAMVITENVEDSTFKTVEALATAVARVACTECDIEKVTVAVEKPSALTFAEAAGVEITRHRAFFERNESLRLETDKWLELGGNKSGTSIAPHKVFVGIGSNIGDRLQWIRDAVNELDRRNLSVKKTSSLYESKPMYIVDQPEFLNAVCEVCTFPPISCLTGLTFLRLKQP